MERCPVKVSSWSQLCSSRQILRTAGHEFLQKHVNMSLCYVHTHFFRALTLLSSICMILLWQSLILSWMYEMFAFRVSIWSPMSLRVSASCQTWNIDNQSNVIIEATMINSVIWYLTQQTMKQHVLWCTGSHVQNFGICPLPGQRQQELVAEWYPGISFRHFHPVDQLYHRLT